MAMLEICSSQRPTLQLFSVFFYFILLKKYFFWLRIAQGLAQLRNSESTLPKNGSCSDEISRKYQKKRTRQSRFVYRK
jgi:hypothetical protein